MHVKMYFKAFRLVRSVSFFVCKKTSGWFGVVFVEKVVLSGLLRRTGVPLSRIFCNCLAMCAPVALFIGVIIIFVYKNRLYKQ